QFVDGFIAVSDFYAARMCSDLGIPENKMRVVPLGINFAGYEKRTRSDSDEFVVGYFARVAPEKGLHVLAEAYQLLRQQTPGRRIRLEIAGYLAPEYRDYLSGIERQCADWGLADEVKYRGVLDRPAKIEFLRGLDVMSVPATYDEPKGMSLLEAMAVGVPVVQPRRGSFTEIVGRTGGGLLVDACDAESIAAGLMTLRRSPLMSADLGEKAFAGVREHYSVSNMAMRSIEAYATATSAPPVDNRAVEVARG